MTTSSYTVTGMSCEHCVASVRDEVAKIDGATGVAVDLASGVVTVDADCTVDPAAVSAAVEEAGYEVAGM
jgi:copper chaperone CopZ